MTEPHTEPKNSILLSWKFWLLLCGGFILSIVIGCTVCVAAIADDISENIDRTVYKTTYTCYYESFSDSTTIDESKFTEIGNLIGRT